MGNHSATYTDNRGRQLDIEVDEDASAWVGLRLSENREPLGIVIPADKRETLARALAGWHHGVQPAQPDRPEPVDPSSVRVGDVVEIEGEDWMVRGPVTDTDADQPYPISVVVPSVGGAVIWPHMRQATVRILRRAEPEPDPAAVEALARALHAITERRRSVPRSWEEIATQDTYRDQAHFLIRDHGVRVEVPDA